jgi:hypothetical protein
VVGNSTRHQVKRYQAARVRTGVTATALRNAIDADQYDMHDNTADPFR